MRFREWQQSSNDSSGSLTLPHSVRLRDREAGEVVISHNHSIVSDARVGVGDAGVDGRVDVKQLVHVAGALLRA